MSNVLTPQMRQTIAQNCNAVFADPNASTAQVLEAVINYLNINSIQFHTASGEISLHLQNAVTRLRDLDAMQQTTGRRYLGMPQERVITPEMPDEGS